MVLGLNKIYRGDALEVLKTFPDESINCVVTSPPYWALRNYGMDGQLGLEPTFDLYIKNLCDIFDEVKRVLKKDGTCWVNIGDTYMGNSSYSEKGRQGFGKDKIGMINKQQWVDPKYKSVGDSRLRAREHVESCDIKSKSLCNIPARFSIEMTNREWILRNEIIWYKPNAMPSSVKDRFTVDFEKVFFFVKSKQYYFETQYEDFKSKPTKLRDKRNEEYNKAYLTPLGKGLRNGYEQGARNRRCVWQVNTTPLKDSHFATYPKKLIEPMIQAGCPKDGIVLDMFMGAGTTGVVALSQHKNYVGIELNPEYITIAEKRIQKIKDKEVITIKDGVIKKGLDIWF